MTDATTSGGPSTALPRDVARRRPHERAITANVSHETPAAITLGRVRATPNAQAAAPKPRNGEARTKMKAMKIHMTAMRGGDWDSAYSRSTTITHALICPQRKVTL